MPSLRTLFRRTSARTHPIAKLPAIRVPGRRVRRSAHGERVAELADRMAEAVGIDAPLRMSLRQAAVLHEAGTYAVPRGRLRIAEPLPDAEVERLHVQAERAAMIARATGGELAVTILRHQHEDEATLRRRLGERSDAYRLTLLLRVADVADGGSHARRAMNRRRA